LATFARQPWITLSAQADGDDHAVGEDLFTHVGIDLPPARASRQAVPEIEMFSYNRHGRSWRVYRNLAMMDVAPAISAESDQLSLGLPVSRKKVTRVIMPQYAMFMSATIRGFCRDSRMLESAARHLMDQDILYLGDLTQMSRRELAFRLGRYRVLAKAFDECLTSLGLAFDSQAPWWQRPSDYYARAY